MRDVQLWAYDTVSGTWKKYLVDADGHPQVDVLSTALPTGAATSAKQDTELTELQAKLETAELSIEAITKYLNINVKNLPTEYPLTAAQVADLKIITSYPDPVISQPTPASMKHVPHGYYAAGPSYLPLAVDSAGKQLITLSALAHLDDIDDVSVAAPTDGYVLYWDAATSLWKCKLISASKIVDADADTKVDVEESADEDKIRMDVKGVEAFLLHDDGILDLAKQSAFRAFRATAQAIPTATYTKVQAATVNFDIQNEYDETTNYRFIAKKAGVYIVCAAFTFVDLADGKRFIICVYVNGASAVKLMDLTTGGAADAVGSGAMPFQLAASDYVEIFVYHTYGANRNILGYWGMTKVA